MAKEMPPELHNRIMHTKLIIGDAALMGADAPPKYYQKPEGLSISLSYKDVKEGERVFNALADGGTVKMAFQKTFWALGFGMCIDKFGIPWMVNCEEEE